MVIQMMIAVFIVYRDFKTQPYAVACSETGNTIGRTELMNCSSYSSAASRFMTSADVMSYDTLSTHFVQSGAPHTLSASLS